MALQTAELEPLDVLSLREHIEKQVRQAMLDGTFKPGERIVESALADQLGVSRAPVREALAALEQEGIIFQIPRRGYFVVDFTDTDIEEVYSLRLILEMGALKRTIERTTTSDLTKMQRMVDKLGRAALQKKDPRMIVSLDLAFHEYICRVAGHSRLYSAWDKLRLQTELLIGLTSKTHYDNPQQPREWHQKILNAIQEKNLERASAILKDHIIDAQERARKALHIEELKKEL